MITTDAVLPDYVRLPNFAQGTCGLFAATPSICMILPTSVSVEACAASTGEREVSDSAGCRDHFHVVALLERL